MKNTSVRIIDLEKQIRTRDSQNRRQKCVPLDNDAGPLIVTGHISLLFVDVNRGSFTDKMKTLGHG
jgi:hypothetical protein